MVLFEFPYNVYMAYETIQLEVHDTRTHTQIAAHTDMRERNLTSEKLYEHCWIYINKCQMQTHVQEFTHPVLEKELSSIASIMHELLFAKHT